MQRFLIAALLLYSSTLFSQEFRATITGAVTDGTGAAIANAKIAITEIKTNTRTETVTEANGHYTVPFLLPGDYDISVKFEGFKEFVRKGLHLGAGENPVIDASLTVGDSIQAV